MEAVAKLAGGDKEHEQELLRHGVACPRVTQYRADKLLRVLDECGSVGGVLHLLRLGDLRSLVTCWGSSGLRSII